MNFIARLFEEHKLVRRATLAWACWLISTTVLRVTEPAALPWLTGAVAATVGTVVGLLGTVIGFYMWSRNREDGKDVNNYSGGGL